MVEEEGSCCRCCCSFIFTSGLTALFLWLNLKVSNPTCSIENFDVFALNKTATRNSTFHNNNHTIRFDFKLNNKNNKDKGIYYDTLNLTFYYKPNLSLITVAQLGNATFPPFYQGHGKNTHRISAFDARGLKWENASATTALFRVQLNTSVRFKIVFWKTKRHRLELGADLLVNEQGTLIKINKKGTKLTSAASRTRLSCNFQILAILGLFFLTHFFYLYD